MLCTVLIPLSFTIQILGDRNVLVGRGLLRLLLATILIDTANMDATYNKATEKDRNMVQILIKKIGYDGKDQVI